MISTFSGGRSFRGHCSIYVLTTTACSVSSTSSHTDPATVPSPARHAPSPSGTGRYRSTSRPLWTDTPQKSVTTPNLRAGESRADAAAALADKTGLTGRLSKALATPRLLIHDRGRVLADLACAIADGAEVISDFRVVGDQKQELFGRSPRFPRPGGRWMRSPRAGTAALARITRAVNAARRQAWAAIEARHGALPGVRIADKVLHGVTCIRLDATVTPADCTRN